MAILTLRLLIYLSLLTSVVVNSQDNNKKKHPVVPKSRVESSKDCWKKYPGGNIHQKRARDQCILDGGVEAFEENEEKEADKRAGKKVEGIRKRIKPFGDNYKNK